MAAKKANKILVIDDDSDILDFLIAILDDEVSISFASEGAKALELVELHKPDLILLDVIMPGMDGFEVCKRLKDNPKTQHIPVIFISGKSEGENMVKGLELGAVDYITKPFDPEIVAVKIQNILKQITATRASAKPVEQDAFAPGGSSDRRAEGARRPDRFQNKAEANGPAVERRAQGAARPDRFHKQPAKASSGSLVPILIVALIVTVGAGGGYVWFNKDSFESLMGDGASSKTKTQAPEATPKASSQNFNLSESDIQAVIAEADESYQSDSKSGQSASLPASTQNTDSDRPSTTACESIPKVPWWGKANHDSIIAYVNNKNSGNWNAYIDKWERQLAKLQSVHSKGGTVIAPKIGTRLKGPVLAEYISQVDKRVKATRCIANILAGE